MIELSKEQEASLQALVEGKYFESIEEGLAFLFRHLEAMRQEGSLLTIEEHAELERRIASLDRGEGIVFNSIEELDAHLRAGLAERKAARVKV